MTPGTYSGGKRTQCLQRKVLSHRWRRKFPLRTNDFSEDLKGVWEQVVWLLEKNGIDRTANKMVSNGYGPEGAKKPLWGQWWVEVLCWMRSECEVELWKRHEGLGVLSIAVVQPDSVCPGFCQLLGWERPCLYHCTFHHQVYSHKMQLNCFSVKELNLETLKSFA